MRRVAMLVTAMTLGMAVPASAWVELPPYPIPHDGVADCLRAAGPGQLTLLGRLGRTTSATDLLRVGPHGVVRTSSTTLGWLGWCPEIGVAPGVPPLLAAPVLRGASRFSSVLGIADAGAAPTMFGPPATYIVPPAVAVAPDGAAVVAWAELVPNGSRPIARVLATARPADGAPFGRATTLGTSVFTGLALAAGIDAAGKATIAWVDARSILRVTSTTGDGRFTASRPIASSTGEGLAMAVAPGGRTLIADYGSGAIAAYERTPGASPFVPVPVATSQSSSDVALVLADDGGAVIAYRSDEGAVFSLLRRPGGPFGPERVLAGPVSENDSGQSLGGLPSRRPVAPPDADSDQIAAALDARDNAIITWVAPPGKRSAASALVSRGTIATGMKRATRLGSPCRTANAAQPLVLADGTLGAAWTDNANVHPQERAELATGGGLLHILRPGRSTATADSDAPSVSAQLVGPRVLRVGHALRLRVRCRRGPCVVRALATEYGAFADEGNDSRRVEASTEVPRGRSAELQFGPSDGARFAPPGGGPARIALTACPLRGARVTRSALRLHLRTVPPRPLPRVLDLVARRHGHTIHVTWHTSIPASGVTFLLLPDPIDYLDPVYAEVHGRGRDRFSVTLRERSGTHERSVYLVVSSAEQESHQQRVRIR